MILRLMKTDDKAFTQFMLKSRRKDAGDAACREFYGMGILDMARDFVGAGDWESPVLNEAT